MKAETAISVLVLDIDGVLTDGSVTLDESGHEQKTLFYRDIDALFGARREGLKLVLITGEDSDMGGNDRETTSSGRRVSRRQGQVRGHSFDECCAGRHAHGSLFRRRFPS